MQANDDLQSRWWKLEEKLIERVLSALPEGQCWVSEVILKPRITFAAHQQVDASAVAHFHELAQRDCFIARSIKTKVTIRSA